MLESRPCLSRAARMPLLELGAAFRSAQGVRVRGEGCTGAEKHLLLLIRKLLGTSYLAIFVYIIAFRPPKT